MVSHPSPLLALVQLIDQIPVPPRPRARGRPPVYPDRLFLKALVIMIVRRLATVHAVLAVLEQPTPEMQQVRALLSEQGRYPTRPHLGATPRCPPGHASGSDRLPGPAPSRADPTVGADRAGGGSGQHHPARPRWGLAQEASGGRDCPAHLHRHRGALDEVRLAWLGVRLAATRGRFRGCWASTRGPNPVFCHRYPTKTCGWSNLTVGKLLGQCSPNPRGKRQRREAASGLPASRQSGS